MKFSLDKTIRISLAFAWISVFNSVFDTALPLILTAPLASGGLNLSYTMKGLVMAIDNILGLFILPLFGYFSDKTKTKFGKRTPYIIIGAFLAIISWVGAGIAIYLGEHIWFIVSLGLGLAFISMSRPAALSLLPDLTSMKNRRKANAITQIISVVCTLVGIVVVTLLLSRGYELVFYATSAIMLVLLVVFLFTVHERKWTEGRDFDPTTEKDEELLCLSKLNYGSRLRNRICLLSAVFFFYMAFNGMVSSLPNYATEVLGLNEKSFTVPQLLCLVSACAAAVPASKIAAKVKRKTMLAAGLLIMLVAFTTVGFLNSLNALMIICFIVAGVGYSVAIVNLYPFMLELSDPEQIGKNTGIFNTSMMLAMIVTPILSGALTDKYSLGILFPYCIAMIVLAVVSVLIIREKKGEQGEPACSEQ